MIFGDFWKNLLFRLFTNDLPESGGNGKKNPVSYPVYRAVHPGRSEGDPVQTRGKRKAIWQRSF